MKFNPIAIRAEYDSWALEDLLGRTYDTSLPMGNVAIFNLNEVLIAWLIGLYDQAAPVISRCLEWLEIAIENDEDFGENRNFHRQNLHWSKALGTWMLHGKDPVNVWKKTRLFAEAAPNEGKVWSKRLVRTLFLDDYMAQCYLAEQYDVGIAEFEKYHGTKAVSMKRTLRPREYAYALCMQRRHEQFDEGELFEAGRKMLRANLNNEWLGMGQYKRAVTWLKIVYWNRDRTLTPLQSILKAYENMPGVPKPGFVR